MARFRSPYLAGAAERARSRAWGARDARDTYVYDSTATHNIVAASESRRADRGRGAVAAAARSECRAVAIPVAVGLALPSTDARAFAIALSLRCSIALSPSWRADCDRALAIALDRPQHERATVRTD